MSNQVYRSVNLENALSQFEEMFDFVIFAHSSNWVPFILITRLIISSRCTHNVFLELNAINIEKTKPKQIVLLFEKKIK